MTQALTQIIRGADKNATHCIIWLHGLGATADDFLPILPYLSLQNSTKIIFPQAPSRAITVNNGMYMPGWYDIVDFTLRDADTAGIEQSAAQSVQFIKAKLTPAFLLDKFISQAFHKAA